MSEHDDALERELAFLGHSLASFVDGPFALDEPAAKVRLVPDRESVVALMTGPRALVQARTDPE